VKSNTTQANVNIIGEGADGSRRALTLIQAVRCSERGDLAILVKLPDVKVDPQEVANLKLQLEGQAGMMKSMSDEIEQWKKRFDALLFQKGGAA
jgi:hypothetical protein